MIRIPIFSYYPEDQEVIRQELLTYFRKKINTENLKIEMYSEITSNKFARERDILVILDRRTDRKDMSFRGKVESSLLTAAENVCKQNGTPCIRYEGEIKRNIEREFICKIESVEKEVLGLEKSLNSL